MAEESVGPGWLTVELDRMSARGGKGKGRAGVGGKTACECELMFVIVDL